MEQGLELIKNSIETEVKDITQSLGILCRVFCRVKTLSSLSEKINRKGPNYYSVNGAKIQDIVGVRIVTYFYEDVDILWNIMQKKMIVDNLSKSDSSLDQFSVQRKNMVCKMSSKNSQILQEISRVDETFKICDNTFEIQFRTIFSEGWHEIDHLLKYKCKKDWNSLDNEARTFNGIYATLETSDRALRSLFDDITYHHYRQSNWEAMLRMKYKLEFENKALSQNLIQVFTSNSNVAKDIFRSSRSELLYKLSEANLHIPITFDNIVFMVNRMSTNHPDINNMEPTNIKMDLDNHFLC